MQFSNLNMKDFAGGREFSNILAFGPSVNPYEEGKIVAEINNPAHVGKLKFFGSKKKRST